MLFEFRQGGDILSIFLNFVIIFVVVVVVAATTAAAVRGGGTYVGILSDDESGSDCFSLLMSSCKIIFGRKNFVCKILLVLVNKK